MIKIFAHRGYRALYPENTLLAFSKALETGCYGIELDVQLSKDGELVIMHDETLDRTTSGTGYLKDYTLSELKGLDAGCGEKIPTLGEYFELIRGTGVVTNIELKNSSIAYEGLEEKVIDKIRSAGVTDRVILSSFKLGSAIKAKELAPDIEAALIAGEFLDPENVLKLMLEHKLDYIHPGSYLYWRSLKTPALQRIIESFPANIWTVNDEWEARKLVESGVNALFTDNPGFMLEIAL